MTWRAMSVRPYSTGPCLPRRDRAPLVHAALRDTPARLLPDFLQLPDTAFDSERLSLAPENYMAAQERELMMQAAETIARTAALHCVVVALEPGPALGGVDSVQNRQCMVPLLLIWRWPEAPGRRCT